jgi:NAD-dependent SIR2 family protein deacetylase
MVVGAGAGMGVDSGLPDFRGPTGFWRAYPAYERLGLRFEQLANPQWFADDPALAWGFYGHRRNLYRAIQPHDGFRILLSWAAHMRHGAFVFTSNVDAHFQKAGFDPDRVYEVHGSIEFNQCLGDCGIGIHPAGLNSVDLDHDTMRARPPLPACPECGELARPNILMFGDWEWMPARSESQWRRLEAWLGALTGKLVVVECGAGTAVPTVRSFCERLTRAADATLIRLNVREPDVPRGHVGLAVRALDGLRALEEAWND